MRELLAKRAAIQAEMSGLAAKGISITAAEDTRFTAAQIELARVNAAIERKQATEGWNETSPVDASFTQDQRNNTGRPFASFGEQMQSVIRASGSNPQVDRKLHAVQAAATGMSEAVPADGGFAVQTDFSNEIMNRVYDNSQLASRVRRIQIGANSNGISVPFVDETSRADGSRLGGVRGYWANEAATVTATKPKLGRMTMSLEKLMAICYMTEELKQDAAALGSFTMQGFRDEIAFKLQDAIVRGSGAGQCLGILNSGALVSVTKEVGQAADTIVFENVMKMWSRLYGPSRTNAIWLVNQDAEPQLYSMSLAVGTGGVPVYLPAGGLSTAPYSTLFGRPVIPLEQCDTVGDQGDIMLVDPTQYFLIEKGGLQEAVSMHVQFLYAEDVLRLIYRVNGQPWWKAPLTPANSSNTLSPFVALDARA